MITDDWLNTPETQSVFDALEAQGAQAWLVGGCVRNALMGEPVSDIDICTDALPETIMTLAKQAGIKAIPTGIDHGTITLIAGGIAHEVTTLRRDVETDGRHATVVFGRDMTQDAARRDFTMNALYADRHGRIVDPLNGLPDLKARRVRFIGAATDRIREDYLRSLRYFRFQARYGQAQDGPDPEALSAIAENLEGLDQLSRERVGSELSKILAVDDPAPAMALMRSTGVLAQVLPGAQDRALAPLIYFEEIANLEPHIALRFAALGAVEIYENLRQSRKMLAEITLLRDAATSTRSAAELGYRLKEPAARRALALRAALLEQPLSATDLTVASEAADQVFPLKAADLTDQFSGAALGNALKQAESDWIRSGFALTKSELIARQG